MKAVACALLVVVVGGLIVLAAVAMAARSENHGPQWCPERPGTQGCR